MPPRAVLIRYAVGFCSVLGYFARRRLGRGIRVPDRLSP
jgi:hypothetical protein